MEGGRRTARRPWKPEKPVAIRGTPEGWGRIWRSAPAAAGNRGGSAPVDSRAPAKGKHGHLPGVHFSSPVFPPGGGSGQRLVVSGDTEEIVACERRRANVGSSWPGEPVRGGRTTLIANTSDVAQERTPLDRWPLVPWHLCDEAALLRGAKSADAWAILSTGDSGGSSPQLPPGGREYADLKHAAAPAPVVPSSFSACGAGQ